MIGYRTLAKTCSLIFFAGFPLSLFLVAGSAVPESPPVNPAGAQPVMETGHQETGPAVLNGKVVDIITGQPLGNVLIRLQSTKESVITDRQGRFQFSRVAPGKQVLFVSAVNYALLKQDVDMSATGPVEVTISLTPGNGAIADSAEVTAGEEPVPVAARQTLRGAELQNLSGGVVDDPMRAVQALPGVTTGDDMRCEFAVRGSGFGHIGTSVDGVATPLLSHVFEQEDTGSVSMINSEVLESAVLMNGSYPARYGNRIGAWIEYTLREGSRERWGARVTASAVSVSGLVEGPLGQARKGSFMAACRYNYIDWLLKKLDATGSAFNFIDTQGKLVYGLTGRHQLEMSWLAGQARLNNEEERLTADINDDWKSKNMSGLVTLALRTVFGPRLLLTQRIAAVASDQRIAGFFENEQHHGKSKEILYRSDVVLTANDRLAFEGGGEVRKLSENRRDWIYGWTGPAGGPFEMIVWRSNQIDSHAWQYSAYGLGRWQPAANVTVSPGARVDHQTLTGQTVFSPWLQTGWKPGHNWEFTAGTGVYHQFPDFDQVLGWKAGGTNLRPERAWHADLGVTRQFGKQVRFHFTAYNRQERDILRLRNFESQIYNGVFINPFQFPVFYRNLLRGYSRGMEFQLRLENPNGLAGWVSYSLAWTRYRDESRQESFWGDYDQRHTINAFAQYRFTPATGMSVRFRYGSNFPVAGYYEKTGDNYYITNRKNLERLPAYARLDIRANHTFNLFRQRVTLFAEVINVLNRTNYRKSLSWVDVNMMVQSGLLEETVPVLPSVGLLIEF